MKKSFYFFTLLLASCLLNAQTLTQAYHEPVITEVDRNYKLDTTAYTTGLPLAITGTNVVWDFSLLTGMFPVINDTIITPTAAVSGTAYPSATYCQKRNDIFTFYKSESNPSQTELVGVYSPTLSFTFTNTAIIATYPVAYGYSKTDGVSGSFKFGTNTGACNGSITVVADGMGTVKFPFGATFNNVLRLKSVQELTVSSGLFPLEPSISIFIVITHQEKNIQFLPFNTINTNFLPVRQPLPLWQQGMATISMLPVLVRN